MTKKARNTKRKGTTRKSASRRKAADKAPRMSSDRFVLWSVAALAAIGVVAVYSAITFLAVSRAGMAPESFLYRHLIRTGLALAAMVLISRIDYHRVAAWAKPLLLISLGLLVLVQITGATTFGAERWLRIGSLSIQPSDIARVALVLHVGFLLASKQLYIDSLERSFLPLLFWIIPTVLLIGVEDLSTAAMLLSTMLVMCFVGRTRLIHIASLGVALAACGIAFLSISPERTARVTSWVETGIFASADEGDDVSDEGYQARQARIAFAMGGLTGRGPGKSVQRDFLPAPYNDFIFAIVGEEYGLVGALSLLFLFCVLLFRGFMRIARAATDPLGLFLAVGITTMIALYGFVNAGVACSLFPVTGLPMPFVSYGGTSLLASGVLMGVLLNISRASVDVAFHRAAR
ncbi:MAG: putative peptidoglycan glycosyltransferase FtsW [Candidatus Latescibacterota bacterium]